MQNMILYKVQETGGLTDGRGGYNGFRNIVEYCIC